jgi:hypothetical protein
MRNDCCRNKFWLSLETEPCFYFSQFCTIFCPSKRTSRLQKDGYTRYKLSKLVAATGYWCHILETRHLITRLTNGESLGSAASGNHEHAWYPRIGFLVRWQFMCQVFRGSVHRCSCPRRDPRLRGGAHLPRKFNGELFLLEDWERNIFSVRSGLTVYPVNMTNGR